MSPDDRRTADMALAGLLEPHDYMHLLRPARVKHKRRPSFARMARLGRKLGLDVEVARDGTMTLKTGKPGTSTDSVNPWDEVLS